MNGQHQPSQTDHQLADTINVESDEGVLLDDALLLIGQQERGGIVA